MSKILKKRILCCIICFLALFTFVGSSCASTPVLHGYYYAAGDYEYGLTPYLLLVPRKNEFDFGKGTSISAVSGGAYQIEDEVIIATTQRTTLKFKIEDKTTLVLIENGDESVYKIPLFTQFIYSKELK
ncbi:MAG: hypothetical protein IJD75_05095 [Clostridia bacterium]|nr:hypothetical protein [Clostridia bacterium]